MRPRDLSTVLKTFIENRRPVLIKGAPGIGKTDIIKASASAAGADLIISHPVVDDPVDYKGMPFIIDKRAEFMPFGNLQKIIDAKGPTVYFMDDLGQAPPAVQAAAMQLLLAREINGKKVSDHVTFMAATNRKQDKAGVSGILEPVKSRFATIIELEPTHEDWTAWALANGIDTMLIAFIRFRPELLFDDVTNTDDGRKRLAERQADMTNGPCPRTVENVDRILKMKLPEELEYEVISGAIGEGWAAEFVGFVRIARKMPDPDQVLMKPEEAPVPEEPATLYALCGALGMRATEQTMPMIVEYANRLPADFSVLTVMDSVTKGGSDVTKTRAFIDWANKHQDVLM